MLLAVIFMLALLTISLTVAVPDMTKSIQRDQEVETMHRGMQYRRAIQLYYRKFGVLSPLDKRAGEDQQYPLPAQALSRSHHPQRRLEAHHLRAE